MLTILDISALFSLRNVNYLVLHFLCYHLIHLHGHCCKAFEEHIPEQNSLEGRPLASEFSVQPALQLVGTW